jgi:hypothetical protein
MAVQTVLGPLPVAVGKAELAACLDALLGNVFAHTPDGTLYLVRLARAAEGGAHLSSRTKGPASQTPRWCRAGRAAPDRPASVST